MVLYYYQRRSGKLSHSFFFTVKIRGKFMKEITGTNGELLKILEELKNEEFILTIPIIGEKES